MPLTSVKDFTPGGQVLAADVDNVNCGVKVFAGTAERDAAYGGAFYPLLLGSPFGVSYSSVSGERTLEEGEVCYLQSTNQLLVYNGTAWVNW